MNSLKNVSPFLLAILMLIIVGAIMLLPIDHFLETISFSKFESEYISLTLKMGFLFVLSFIIIKKLNLTAIGGIDPAYSWKFKYLNFIPIYLFIIGVLSIVHLDLSGVNLVNVVLLLFGCLAVGFGEEFLFRGLLQSLFIKKFHNNKRGLFFGVFIPALCFGLFHLVNLVKNDAVIPVLIQVVFATFIGFFFGVLLLKTNKLIPLAITHGLINFFFSLQTLPSLNSTVAGSDTTQEIGAAIAPLILFLPLFIVGLFVIRKIEKETVNLKLLASFNKEL